MTLLLLAGDDRGLEERGGVLLLLGWDGALLRQSHGTIVATVCVGRHSSDSFRTFLSFKVIRLIG